jgi:hypothetical protein
LPNGRPKKIDDLTVTIALPDKKIAPIKVPLQLLSDGSHYLAPGFNVPIAGTWRVTAKPVVSQFKELTIRGDLEVNGT